MGASIAEAWNENFAQPEAVSRYPSHLGLITERVKGTMGSTVALSAAGGAAAAGVAMLGAAVVVGTVGDVPNFDAPSGILSDLIFPPAVIKLQKYSCEKWDVEDWDTHQNKLYLEEKIHQKESNMEEKMIYRPAKVYCMETKTVVSLPKDAKYSIISHHWLDRKTPQKKSYIEGAIESIYFSSQAECDMSLELIHKVIQNEKYVWWDVLCLCRDELIRMGAFYINAKVCYVFVDPIISIAARIVDSDLDPWKIKNSSLKWFNRVWTLQEMIMSRNLKFVSYVGWEKGNNLFKPQSSKLVIKVKHSHEVWGKVMKRLNELVTRKKIPDGDKTEDGDFNNTKNGKVDNTEDFNFDDTEDFDFDNTEGSDFDNTEYGNVDNSEDGDFDIAEDCELIDAEGLKRFLNSHSNSSLFSIRTRLFEMILSRKCTYQQDHVYAMICLEPTVTPVPEIYDSEFEGMDPKERYEYLLKRVFNHLSNDMRASILCAMSAQRCTTSGLSLFPSFAIGEHNPLSSIIDTTLEWYGPEEFHWSQELGVNGEFWMVKQGILADLTDFQDFKLTTQKEMRLGKMYRGLRYLKDRTNSHSGLRFLTFFRNQPKRKIQYVKITTELVILRARRINLASVYIIQGIILRDDKCHGNFVALVTFDDVEKKKVTIY
ncbi:hypothetical protein HK096_006627 [Nowakowskiella sp. JEL0078]|nr:hypothetical protein HK096_006627 [Nowakowskiella sp. JEL0078]